MSSDIPASTIPVACSECRATKVRCLPLAEPGGRCKRCERLSLECVYLAHRKGRKPAASRSSEAGPSASPGSNKKPRLHSAHGSSTAHANGFGRAYSNGVASGSSVAASPAAHAAPAATAPISLARSSASQAQVLSRPPPSLADLLQPWMGSDPSLLAHIPPSPRPPPWEHLDPVSLDIVTLDEGRKLFAFFFAYYLPWCAMFDPTLHTHDYVRSASPFLYTALLLITARLAIPADEATDEHRRLPVPILKDAALKRRQLTAHVDLLRTWSFKDGEPRIETCQALFCLATWKEPDDRLSYLHCGFSFRIAMAMALDAKQSVSDKGDAAAEAEHRWYLNRQRTWLALFMQDRTQCMHYLTTPTFPHDNELITECTLWHAQPGTFVDDKLQCASVDCRRMQSKYLSVINRLAPRQDSPSCSHSALAEGPNVLLPALQSEVREWNARWHGEVQRAHAGLDPSEWSHKSTILEIWINSIELHVSTLGLKYSFQHARQADLGSLLTDMPALWPCVRTARAILIALTALPPLFLRSITDGVGLLAPWAALLLCRLASIQRMQKGGESTAAQSIDIIRRCRDAFMACILTSTDNARLFARTLDGILQETTAKGAAAHEPQEEELSRQRNSRGTPPRGWLWSSDSLSHRNVSPKRERTHSDASPPSQASETPRSAPQPDAASSAHADALLLMSATSNAAAFNAPPPPQQVQPARPAVGPSGTAGTAARAAPVGLAPMLSSPDAAPAQYAPQDMDLMGSVGDWQPRQDEASNTAFEDLLRFLDSGLGPFEQGALQM